MVHCKANQRYLELSGQEWVKTDDPILTAFRDNELVFVDTIMKMIDQKGYVYAGSRRFYMPSEYRLSTGVARKMAANQTIWLAAIPQF